jgi:hypothetical protein
MYQCEIIREQLSRVFQGLDLSLPQHPTLCRVYSDPLYSKRTLDGYVQYEQRTYNLYVFILLKQRIEWHTECEASRNGARPFTTSSFSIKVHALF